MLSISGTGCHDMKKAIKLKDNEGNNIYPCPYFPVGSIYISVNNINPSVYFGGTWERFAKGRTLVGIDENQNEFKETKKEGGSKYLQSHNHTMNSSGSHIHKTDCGETIAVGRWQWQANSSTYAANDNQNGYLLRGLGYAGDHSHTINNSGTGNSGNLQPYITVYIWERIS